MNWGRQASQRSLGLAAVLLLMCAGALQAATLDDYEARLTRVLGLLAGYQAPTTHSGPAATPNLDFISRELPAKETISFQGQTITVDNSWLENELTEYAKSNRSADRTAAIARIAERLKAIQEHVHELKAQQTQITDKDAEKGRLAEILRRPEYLPAAPEGNAFERLLDRFMRWLESLLPKPKHIEPSSSRWLSVVAQIIVIAACVGVIALLIWRFGPRLMSGRGRKKKKREARIVLGEQLDADQTAADLLAQAEALAREGNLRAAIRKAYIALLCELGDRKIISLAQHKTNRDYLNAVRDKGSLYSSMRKLTNKFELHWYGFVPAGAADWDEFRNSYKKIFREQ